MKKLYLLLFLITATMFAFSQEPVTDQPVIRKNSIKFLPVNMAFNSITFEFERMISPKNAFTLGIGIPSNNSFASRFYSGTGDPGSQSYGDKLGVMSVRAAYRHYGGNSGLPKGFYISPYLKYQDFKLDLQISSTDDTGSPYDDKIDMKGNTMNLGFQMGYQFLIGKRVNLDFYFFGLEAGLLTFDGSATPHDPADIDSVEADVRDFVDGLPTFIGDKMEVSKTSSQVKLKGSSIPYPFFRGGISLGIAF